MKRTNRSRLISSQTVVRPLRLLGLYLLCTVCPETSYYCLLTFLLVSLTEVLTIERQSPSYQMELCDVQADSFMRGKRDLDS